MENKRNIHDWCKAFNRHEINADNAGWYDWFCKDSALEAKTRRLGLFLNAIRDSKKLEFKHHVWFKNNCPCVGSLYDDIRFTDEEKNCNAFVISFKDNRVEVIDVRLFNDDPNSDQAQAKVFEGTRAEAIDWFNS